MTNFKFLIRNVLTYVFYFNEEENKYEILKVLIELFVLINY